MLTNRSQDPSNFSRVAASVASDITGSSRTAVEDRDAEWQRVNSYVADVLKDAHVLYSKLARLQGDFAGRELSKLEEIGEGVLDIGEELSHFMKAFHEGEAGIAGQEPFGSKNGAPPGTPPPVIPSEFEEKERGDDDYEGEIRREEDGELEEYEEEEE